MTAPPDDAKDLAALDAAYHAQIGTLYVQLSASLADPEATRAEERFRNGLRIAREARSRAAAIIAGTRP